MRCAMSEAVALPARRALLGALLLPFAPRAQAAAPEALEIVTRADAIRNPAQPFRVTTRLSEYRDGKLHDAATLTLYSKPVAQTGQYRNLARYVDPAADAGKALLMADKIMWFYDPASQASVRISPQQRLVGQASNGDVVTVNFAHDYKPGAVVDELVKDADNQPRPAWRVDLAATESAIYLRIELWVERETCRPLKARFYADSGRALKTAYYRRYADQLGAQRPTEVIILDEVDASVVTKMAFSDYRGMELPDSWFQRDFLPHLRAQS
jgi:hypothetical protein